MQDRGPLRGGYRRGLDRGVSRGAAPHVRHDEEDRTGGRLSRHEGRRSLSLARGRHLTRDRGVGCRAECDHVPLSRANSLSRGAAQARDGAQRLRALLGAVAQGTVLFLQQELGAPEPERPVRPEGARRRARGAARPERVVGRRDGAAQRVRAVEGRDVRRLRDLAQRLRLAAVQSHGARDEAHARRHARLGEGVDRRVGGRGLLLQPLSRAGRGAREGLDQREPPSLLPRARHEAVRRQARLRGRQESAALPRRLHDRGRALRDPRALGARQRHGRQRALRPRPHEARQPVCAADPRDHERHLQRRRRRRRQAARRDESRRAELADRARRSRASRGSELAHGASRSAPSRSSRIRRPAASCS